MAKSQRIKIDRTTQPGHKERKRNRKFRLRSLDTLDVIKAAKKFHNTRREDDYKNLLDLVEALPEMAKTRTAQAQEEQELIRKQKREAAEREQRLAEAREREKREAEEAEGSAKRKAEAEEARIADRNAARAKAAEEQVAEREAEVEARALAEAEENAKLGEKTEPPASGEED